MIAKTPSLRGTVMYLIYMSYWIHKKFATKGLPPNCPSFASWQQLPIATVPSPPRKITVCSIFPATGFVDFVVNSEFRSSLNRSTPAGELIIVQGMEAYKKTRQRLLNSTLRELSTNPELNCVEALEKYKTDILIPQDIMLYQSFNI